MSSGASNLAPCQVVQWRVQLKLVVSDIRGIFSNMLGVSESVSTVRETWRVTEKPVLRLVAFMAYAGVMFINLCECD